MKSMRFLLCALLASGMAACSDDGPDSNAPTEGYLRAFVKEFGVTADGHDFSMARSAGLSVKASTPTHIVVTALFEGEEYLFGDLNVTNGITKVPVTIPSEITSLYISIGMQKYEVAADGLIDLDNLPNPVENPESRSSIYIDASANNGIGRRLTDTDPVLAFRYDEWLEAYFKEFPIGVDQPAIGLSDREQNWDGQPQPFGETNFARLEDTDQWYIFPIYWKKGEDVNNKTLGIYIRNGYQPTKHSLVVDLGSSWGIPFSKLGYSTTLSDKKSIDWDSFAGFKFDTGSFNEAFPLSDGSNPIVVSQGCLLKFSSPHAHIILSISARWLELKESCTNAELNGSSWNGNYYKSTINGLADALSSTRRIQLPPTEFTIYKDGQLTKLFSDHSLLVGFNNPPTQPNDPRIRDYADVLLLLIPTDGAKLEYSHALRYKQFTWTVAAEDLGFPFKTLSGF